MIVKADARHIPLPDNTVQAIVTSPPYWGLRKYAGNQELVWSVRESKGIVRCNRGDHAWGEPGVRRNGRAWDPTIGESPVGRDYQGSTGSFCQLCGAWRGAFGLEPTIEMYVEHSVEILREVRRVLRADGVCFWNIGDSYSNTTVGPRSGGTLDQWKNGGRREPAIIPDPGITRNSGLKPKDLCLIPARVALAAQADGWWVRSDIIWAKPNPMPESVRDRPTDAYEHILMLTKSASYYWDGDAVREPHAEPWRGQGEKESDNPHAERTDTEEHVRCFVPAVRQYNPLGRNLRNVWTFNEPRRYELPDGTVCIVSEDCPVHGLRPSNQTRKTPVCDVRLNQGSTHTEHSDGCPSPRLFSELLPSSARTSEDSRPSSQDSQDRETSPSRKQRSKRANKKGVSDSAACDVGAQSACDSENIQAGATSPSAAEPNGLDALADTIHSTASSKTVSLSAERGNGGGETRSHIECSEPSRKGVVCSCQWIIPQEHFANTDIWTFSTQSFKGAHFATFPVELVIRCLSAASKPGDLVMDPFGGSGTVGEVAFNMQRRFVLCDLAYQELQRERVPPMASLMQPV